MGARILVVDDEPEMRLVLRTGLQARGFVVDAVEGGRAALKGVETGHPDVILLDLMLPDLTGTAIIEQVRTWSRVPIIVLSVVGGETEKVRALNLGADDYVTKPFGLDELVARIRVALRRVASSDRVAPVFRVGDLVIDFEQRRVTMRGNVVALTPTEYAILKALAERAGQVLTHRALLQAVWGPEYGTEDYYLHVYIGRIRRKVEPDPARPRYVTTEPGAGYRLRLDPLDEARSPTPPSS
jgi:two-component system KDP operon response regulator KdpE